MKKRILKFNQNREFTMMLVGDPHEKYDYSEGIELDKYMDYVDFQNAAIKKVNPDLIVYLGDNGNAETEEELRTVLSNVVEPAVSHDIPFALVYGNHDGESGIPQEYHTKIYGEFDNSMYMPYGYPHDEYGDYCITLKSSDGKKDIFNLWFMKSGEKDEKSGSYYEMVSGKQIEWYEKTSDELKKKNGGKVLPSIVFQHIPVVEEYKLLKKTSHLSLLGGGLEALHGKKGEYYVLDKKHTDVRGYMGETPCTPDVNSGQFESWKKKGDVLGAFFGHDHLNDFIGTVDGIVLGQCKLCGFRQYGDGMNQAVRVITLNEDKTNSFRTEMRYYREIVGNSCRSIHGRLKWFKDKVNVKIDIAEKAAAIGAAAVTVVLSLKKCMILSAD